ncbi:MAG TPA: enoyl-CoA hydratase/isomerase [Phycisphaerales bacterium]|nr:enoyl-CoA hydratase/isomerase [Phycisphaerales bacterium]
MYEKLKVDVRDDVAVLTLNDPSTLNAAGLPLMADLTDAVDRIAAGDIVCRAVILTGEGRGFCSGANLSGRNDGVVNEDRDSGAALESVYNPFVRKFRDLHVPVITAVNGPAAGVGASLALMGDMIVASEEAYFMQAFRRIGLVPDGGSTWMLPRMIGKARAMELMLLGDRLPAPKALDWGLINRCVPAGELMETAMNLASELAKGPASLGMIRALVWASLDSTHDEQLDAERWMQREAGRTDDAIEGVKAFLEKRPAQFTGR